MSLRAARSALARSLAGLNRTGVAIVLIVALINTIRRSINTIFHPPFAGWLANTAETFAEGVLMGVLVLAAVVWAFNRGDRGWRRYIAIGAAVILASGVGSLVIVLYEGPYSNYDPDPSPGVALLQFAAAWLRYASIGLLIAGAWLYLRAEAEYAAALEQCAIDSARSDQQTAEARLQMLEAQIEPHFLFNTLAHVRRLYDIEPPMGRQMLTHLMEYLAVALPQMRETQSTLEREVTHAAAYLEIQRVRMGSRLAVDIDVPAELRGATMPPLMIVTLVENAIKHGVGPQPGGGRIAIRAFTDADRMNVEVADTGQGFAKSSGGGTGLANIRGRLAALFGSAGSLSLKLNAPHGVIATIVLPLAIPALHAAR